MSANNDEPQEKDKKPKKARNPKKNGGKNENKVSRDSEEGDVKEAGMCDDLDIDAQLMKMYENDELRFLRVPELKELCRCVCVCVWVCG